MNVRVRGRSSDELGLELALDNGGNVWKRPNQIVAAEHVASEARVVIATEQLAETQNANNSG